MSTAAMLSFLIAIIAYITWLAGFRVFVDFSVAPHKYALDIQAYAPPISEKESQAIAAKTWQAWYGIGNIFAGSFLIAAFAIQHTETASTILLFALAGLLKQEHLSGEKTSMKQDDTQPIKYANLPNWPTQRLKKWRFQAIKKKAENLATAARHEPGTTWHARAMRDASGCEERIAAIDKVLSEREQA